MPSLFYPYKGIFLLQRLPPTEANHERHVSIPTEGIFCYIADRGGGQLRSGGFNPYRGNFLLQLLDIENQYM
jgi:hypothetical protein